MDVPMEDELHHALKVHCEAVLRLTSAATEEHVRPWARAASSTGSVGAAVPRGTYGASKAWVASSPRAPRRI